MARLMAAITGPRVQLEKPCNISARYTESGTGQMAKSKALRQKAAMLILGLGAVGMMVARHRRQGAEAEGEADGRVGPALGGQIDGDEGPETGLDIGDEQIEEIERTPRPGIHGPRIRHAGIQGRLPPASGGMGPR